MPKFEFIPHQFPAQDDGEGKKPSSERADGKIEQKNLQGRLLTIIKTVSGRSDIDVTTKIDPLTKMKLVRQGIKDPEEEWYFLPRKRLGKVYRKGKDIIHIPKRIFETHEDVAKGKAAHEAGHAVITRFGEFVPDEVLQKLGFHSVMAAVEERPTDQVVRARFPGAGDWVDTARKDNILNSPKYAAGQPFEGMQPQFAQLNELIVHAPHMKEEEYQLFDQKVRDVYEKIRSSVETAEHTLPEEGDTEDAVIARAKDRYRIVFSEIWPEVQKLIEEDKDTQKLKELLKALLKKREEERKKKNEQPPEEEPAPAPEPPSEEPSPEEPSSPPPNNTEEESANPQEENQTLESLLQELEKQLHATEEPPTPTAEGVENGETNPEPVPGLESPQLPSEETPLITIDLIPLSPELEAALQEAFNALTPEEQEELKQMAIEYLESLEDAIVQALTGHLTEARAETHAEFEARSLREREEALAKERREEEESRAQEEMKEIEETFIAAEGERSEYDKIYDEVREVELELYGRLEEVFFPNMKRKASLTSTGSRISLPAVFKWDASRKGGAPVIDNRIFERIYIPEAKDYSIVLLIDLSGSMRYDDKIVETMKAVVILAEVLNRLGIRTAIYGFQDALIKFKGFDEVLDDSIRGRMSGMLNEVWGTNPGGHNVFNQTATGPCLEEASDVLELESTKEKVILTLSDGKPEGPRSKERKLEDVIDKISTKTNQKLVGVGLGLGTEDVTKYFPAALPNIKAKDIPDMLCSLLEDILTNPQKYRNPEAKSTSEM